MQKQVCYNQLQGQKKAQLKLETEKLARSMATIHYKLF